MKKINLALLIPCYNAAPYLPELFESVNSQTMPFSEVICYDDGSTDNTIEIINKFNFQVIHGKVNKGAAYARNRLLELTTCKWVHFHDADDLIDPLFVETMASSILLHQSIVLCGMKVVDRLTRKLLNTVSYTPLNHCNDYITYFLENMGFAIVGVYPVKALRDIGGFRETILANEDPDIHVRLAIAGNKFSSEKEVLVTNLIHSKSFCHNNWSVCWKSKLFCYHQYAKILDKKYHPILIEQILLVAQELYHTKNYLEVTQAINLAQKLGCNTLKSHRKITPFLCKFFGMEFVFRSKLLVSGIRRKLSI